jgi:hypothetical protein
LDCLKHHFCSVYIIYGNTIINDTLKEIKGISIFLPEKEIPVGQDIHGTISINYPGRFDSIVINSQIENSNDSFKFTSLNEKRINHPYGRLSVLKDDIGMTRTLKFIANTTHIPPHGYSNVKFRVAIIQEHKEISHDVNYIKIFK